MEFLPDLCALTLTGTYNYFLETFSLRDIESNEKYKIEFIFIIVNRTPVPFNNMFIPTGIEDLAFHERPSLS